MNLPREVYVSCPYCEFLNTLRNINERGQFSVVQCVAGISSESSVRGCGKHFVVELDVMVKKRIYTMERWNEVS